MLLISWRRKNLILCVRAAWFLGFVGYSNAGCCEEAFVVRYGSRESSVCFSLSWLVLEQAKNDFASFVI